MQLLVYPASHIYILIHHQERYQASLGLAAHVVFIFCPPE
jgi:hypothetical protein